MATPRHLDVLVIMGQTGVGKSTLLNEVFGTAFLTGGDGRHVTLEREEQKVGGVIVVDMPGFALTKGALPSLDRYRGQRVALVLLTHDATRRDTFTSEVAQSLNVDPSAINFFHRADDPVAALRAAFDGNSLVIHEVPHRTEATGTGSSGVINGSAPASTTSSTQLVKKRRSPVAVFFQWVQQYKPLPGDRVLAAVKSVLPELATVQKNRTVGDALVALYVEYFLHDQQLPSSTKDQLVANDRMVSVMDDQCPHFVQFAQQLYPHGDKKPKGEKIADVYEAFLGLVILSPKASRTKKRAAATMLRWLVAL